MTPGRSSLKVVLAVAATGCGGAQHPGGSDGGCAESALCLEVRLGGPEALPEAQLVVVWSTPGVNAAEVAYQAAFTGQERFEGLGVYTPRRPPGRHFDQLLPAAPGTVFELLVCSPHGANACNPPVPNIT